jgi:uncharacterized protein (TIGR02453 family)
MSFEVTLKFLEAVKENNNTTWLHTYRDLFQQEKQRFSDFIESVLVELRKIDPELKDITPKECIFRFNRDIRFSKNKEPYKGHFAAVITSEGKKAQLPCLYIHIEPNGNSMIAGGLYLPPTALMHATRRHIEKHLKKREKIINEPQFKKTFGQVLGKDLKQMPRGYDKESKAADWFLYKSRFIDHPLTDKQVCQTNLKEKIIEYYKIMKPLNDFLSP